MTLLCTACAASSYSFGGTACGTCADGANFASSSLSCTPSASLTAGPADTAFYLSGSQAKSAAAFVLTMPEGLTTVADAFGNAGGALSLANGSYLSAFGMSAPQSLPTGNVAWSVSSWVECAASSTFAAILEWGAIGDESGGFSPEALVLAVQSKAAGLTRPGVLAACDSTWHHVALTYSKPLAGDGLLSTFLDGTLILQLNMTITLPTPADSVLRIGWGGDMLSNGGSLFSGSLSELRVYARTLAMPEVVALAQPLLPVYAPSTQVLLTPPVATVGARSYVSSCTAGYSGPTATLVKSTIDSSWTTLPAGITLLCSACSASTYSFGGEACAVCAPNSAFVSATSSCTPSETQTAGPADTAFYLSGSIAEGVAAFVVPPLANISFTADVLGRADGAIAVPSGSYLSVGGASAQLALPTGNVAWSASAWVRCAPPSPGTYEAVLEWGAAGDVQGAAEASLQSLALLVGGKSGAAQTGVIAACDLAWHHVALTYSPEAMPFSLLAFLDGAVVQQRNGTVVLPATSASLLRIGWSGDVAALAPNLFNGSLTELRIYARALDLSEIVALSQPPLAAYENTIVEPALPTVGATTYTFICAPGFPGQTGILTKIGEGGGWIWTGGLVPSCRALPSSSPRPSLLPSFLPSAAIGSTGDAPLGPSVVAGIAVPILLLACLAAYMAVTRLRTQRQIEALTAKSTMASRAMDRARLLALQATPNAPAFTINFETGKLRTVAELKGEAPAPSPAQGTRVTTNVLHTATAAATAGELPVPSAPAPERIVEIKWADLVPDLSVRGFPKFGGFGAVFVARWTSKRKLVAVKVLKSALLSATQSMAAVEMLMHEAQGLMRASDNGANEHVVQVFGVCQGPAEGWQGAQRAARSAENQTERRRRVRALASAAAASVSGAAGGADPLPSVAGTSTRAFSIAASAAASGSGSATAPDSRSRSADGPDSEEEDNDDDDSNEADIGTGAEGAAVAAAGAAADAAAAGPAPYLFGLIMSYESGGSLQETLFPKRSSGRTSWPSAMLERLRVLKEVATGLYQLHVVGLVHGDLKLENVLLASGAEMRVRLADFGLATLRASADRASRISTIATTDSKRGTYSYMAPEMFESRTARAAAASRSTDVFAFGTLAWELLSSRLAWQGQTEAMRAQALARGESLSAAALPLETPISIGTLVARCMALERRERPRMAEALSIVEQAYENLLSGHFVRPARARARTRAVRAIAGARTSMLSTAAPLLFPRPARCSAAPPHYHAGCLPLLRMGRQGRAQTVGRRGVPGAARGGPKRVDR